MSLPKVSCICPTFGRAYLLEEAIESFHRQDYEGEKELIVCNDFVEQTLEYEHSDVKIINLDTRCPNLGNKRNTTASYATGDVFITWGDDDIHLPKRISRMVNSMTEHNSEFVYEGPYYCLYGGQLLKEPGKTSGAHIITKRLYYELGGIPEMNSGEDQRFNLTVRNKLGPLPVCSDDPQFLYRYTTERTHASQFGPNRGYDEVLSSAIRYIINGTEPRGLYKLKPHWRKDWIEEIKSAIVK